LWPAASDIAAQANVGFRSNCGSELRAIKTSKITQPGSAEQRRLTAPSGSSKFQPADALSSVGASHEDRAQHDALEGGQQAAAPSATIMRWWRPFRWLLLAHKAKEQPHVKLTEREKRRLWLAGALKVKPGGKHRDLGRYRKQNFGVASGFERCPRCGSEPTTQGHDACLANLPGVVNACCGHGLMPPYATLSSGFCLRGKALLIYLEKVAKLERFWRGVTSRSDHP
jgi:hypothetical protein